MKSILTLLIVLVLAAISIATDATVISLDRVDAAGGREVFLCDAASIYGPDRILVARLSSIFLCDAPNAGTSQKIYRTEIRRKIQAAGIDPGRVDVRGSLETVVVGSGGDSSGNPLVRVVVGFLEKYFLGTGEIFKVEFRRLPDLRKPQPAERNYRVIESRSQRYRGHIVVVVGEEVNGKVERRYPVSAEVRTFAKVAVAVRSVKKNEMLNPEDFSLDKRETTRLREPPVTDLSQFAGKRASRNLPRGSVVTIEEIESAPVIEQGDIVTLMVERGNFTITISGRARKSGGVGDLIPVVNLSSHKEVTARVVDAKTVIVEY